MSSTNNLDSYDRLLERKVRREAYKQAKLRRKQHRKIFIMGICLSLVVCMTTISAYLSDSAVKDNAFVMGGSSIDVVEQFDPPKELVPGISFTKNVSVGNVGPNSCYVRVMAVFTNSDMGDYCSVDWNDTDWVYNETDGYWYYTKAVPVNMSTTSLFTTISLSDDIPVELIQSFDMIVYAESYQASGFDDYEDAWANYHKNKPVADGVG